MSISTLPLKKRVALVTGVSRLKSIGFAVVLRLASMGADLFIHSYAAYDSTLPLGRESNEQEEVVARLKEHGSRVEHMDIDFVEEDAPARVITEATNCFGDIDILIANHAHSAFQPLDSLTAEGIDRHLAVNVRATLLLIKEFASQHDQRPGGRIVMLISGQHKDPMGPMLAYGASKGALHQITTSLSDELVEQGITVNTVNPGATDTGWAGPDVYERILRRIPQGRWGQPDDAARLIAWLSTDDARWITGQVIDSEGGTRRRPW